MKLLFFPILLLLFLTACQKETFEIDTISTYDYGGQVTEITFLGEYSPADAIQMIQLAKPTAPVSTHCGFYLYRVQYKTHQFDNQVIIASGLIGIPKSRNIKGLVSWQHYTNPTRAESISNPSPGEGIGMGTLFAADEYLLVAPDYIGSGTSLEVHPYYHTKSTTNAVIDLLKVGEVILNHLTTNRNLYLAGFSQGAGASVATQRALEIENPTHLELKATASISGAFDLRNISLKYSLNQNTTNSLLYLCYVSNAYSLIYNHPLNTFVKPPYTTLIPTWFDGSKTYTFLKANFPAKSTDLFTEAFYNELNANTTNWFTKALDENEMYLWNPKQPLKFYYGTSDIDATPEESFHAYSSMKENGGNVTIECLGAVDHAGSFIEALPRVQAWFNQMK
ncbi:MAG: hypothetical protein RLZZ628_1620 [Bacteroidota bacterium]|jgi:pimeloyl-ACP methyl ester carboxylesterase